jgi:hypothetical protein
MEENRDFVALAAPDHILGPARDIGVEFEKTLQQPAENLPVSAEPLQGFVDIKGHELFSHGILQEFFEGLSGFEKEGCSRSAPTAAP